MRALLLTDIYRVKKSETFRTILGLTIVLNGILLWTRYDRHAALDEGIWALIGLIGIASSILVPSIMGSDTADGTIRNKVIIGKSRLKIFASEMIAAQGMTGILFIVSFLIQIGFGNFVLSGTRTSIWDPLILVLTASMALSAWNVLVCSWCSDRTKSLAICMVSLIVLFLAAFLIQGRLSEPPEIMLMESTNDGEFQNEKIVNARYISGTSRVVFERLMAWLPSGIMIQLAMGMWCTQGIIIVYETVWILVCTALGALGFHKRSIR